MTPDEQTPNTSIPYKQGDNFTIEVSNRVATARVYRRPELGPGELEQAARELLAHAKALCVDPVADGLVIDLRRAPGAVGQAVEETYAGIAASWEASAQPVAFLIDAESIQALQVLRVVSESAPRFGMVTSIRSQAHAFAGNESPPSHTTQRVVWAGVRSMS